MTTLDYGELIFKRGQAEESFAITGGFMEVRKDRVTILADQAEAVEEIDVARAEAARPVLRTVSGAAANRPCGTSIWRARRHRSNAPSCGSESSNAAVVAPLAVLGSSLVSNP